MKISLAPRLVRAAVFGLAVASGPVSLAIAADVFPAGLACKDFALTIQSAGGGNRVYKEFLDKNGNTVRTISAGQGSQLTFSNPVTGATLSLKANGAVAQTTYNPDGSTMNVLTGHNILILFPTDVPAGPTTTLYVGRVVYISDSQSNFTLLGTSGKSVDICAVLSS